MASWAQIAFMPDAETTRRAAEAWAWLLPEPWRPVLCTMFGGLFLETAQGVFWLECGTGDLERVAETSDDLHAFLGGPRDAAWENQVETWFMGSLVDELLAAGKRPGPGQCYSLTILPVFAEGHYVADNIRVLPASDWLAMTGQMHEQLRDLPDGARVRISVVD